MISHWRGTEVIYVAELMGRGLEARARQYHWSCSACLQAG